MGLDTNSKCSKELFQKFISIFRREKEKDLNYHFGYKNWDDIQADTLSHIHSKLSLYNKSKKIEPWISSIVKRQIINKKRDAAARNVSENKIHTAYKSQFGYIAGLNNGELLTQDKNEQLIDIYTIFQTVWKRLSFKLKKIAILFFKHKINATKISQKYNLSVKQVRTRIKLLRQELLKEIKNHKIHIRGQK
jgi:DNA-directed RNA polymerase specialized sigma24 family protein